MLSSAVAIVSLALSAGVGSALTTPRVKGSLGNFTGKRFDAKKAWSRSNSRVSGREAIWDSWKDAGSSSSISKPRSTATQKTKAGTGFVSPLPEGFPPASTLIRPEVDPELGHFLDVSREEYRKHNPSVWQGIKFRLKPFGRLSKRTRVLKINLEGELALTNTPELFQQTPLSLTALIKAIKTAAHDPRIKAVLINVGLLEASLSAIMEVRRAMDYFAQSGKPLWGFSPGILTINELCFLGGCTKVITVPEAYVSFTGFSLGAGFYRGIFDKIGIEPQIRRIGEFKSFGDAYARDSMSAAQKEVTQSLLSAVSNFKLELLARDAGKSPAELETLYDSGPVTVRMLRDFGLIDELLYEDEMLTKLSLEVDLKKKRAADKEKAKAAEDSLRRPRKPAKAYDSSRMLVGLPRYLKRLRALPVEGVPGDDGDETVAVILADGAIVSTEAGGILGGGATLLLVSVFRKQVQAVLREPSIKGVVIRVNSPGGDALASDLLWREVRLLREAGKIVVASVAGVAASGGYYIAMACEKIVCDELSITGSIGVVQTKFALGELFDKVGYKVERTSRGKYSEIFATERSFSEEEDAYWSKTAMQSYSDFVTKAAVSRRMPVEEMHRRAQGRVWTGAQAKALGLVDELGGLTKAVEICRDMIDEKELAQAKLHRALKGKLKERKREPKSGESGDEIDNAEEAGKVEMCREVPVGPLGKDERDYSEVEAQVVAETRKELAETKERTQKPRFTRVKMIGPPRVGVIATLFGGGEASLTAYDTALRMFGMPSRATPASPESALIQGLSALSSPETMRPMAIMDDTIAKLIPGVGGVPEELRRLGVGPLMHSFLLRAPGLADALIQLVSRLGLSSLLES